MIEEFRIELALLATLPMFRVNLNLAHSVRQLKRAANLAIKMECNRFR